MDGVDCFERIFVTRNYGYLLASKDETRLEGQDYIKRVNKMLEEEGFPYWTEKKMLLFVPALQPIDEALYGIK